MLIRKRSLSAVTGLDVEASPRTGEASDYSKVDARVSVPAGVVVLARTDAEVAAAVRAELVLPDATPEVAAHSDEGLAGVRVRADVPASALRPVAVDVLGAGHSSEKARALELA